MSIPNSDEVPPDTPPDMPQDARRDAPPDTLAEAKASYLPAAASGESKTAAPAGAETVRAAPEAESGAADTSAARVRHAPDVEELTATNARLREIMQIACRVVGAAPLEDQLAELARQARQAFRADACIIRTLLDGELHLLACDGVPAAHLTPILTGGWGIAGEIMASRRPLVIADVRQHPITAQVLNTLPAPYLFHAYAGVPLLAADEMVGIIGVYSRQPGAFRGEDGELLRVAAYHIAVAIANDRLYRRMMQQARELEQQIEERLSVETALRLSMEQLQKSLEGTVRAMSSLVEMRDPYTAGHQRRVAILTCTMAAHLKLAPAQSEILRIAGLLHDVGKIAVPAQILCKPTALSAPEWAIIQTHAQAGYDILGDTALPTDVALVALQHHERLDGSGYPAGLRGDDIIASAQILAVADVVEAMASDRPYRPRLPIEAALDEITRHGGARYQTAAVNACLAVLKQYEYDLEALLAAEGWRA